MIPATKILNLIFLLMVLLATVVPSQAHAKVAYTEFSADLVIPRLLFVGESFRAHVHIRIPTNGHDNGDGTTRFYQSWTVNGDPTAQDFAAKQSDYIESKDIGGSGVVSPAIEYFSQGTRAFITQRTATFTCSNKGKASMTYEGAVTYTYHDVPQGQYSFNVAAKTATQDLFAYRHIRCVEPVEQGAIDQTYQPDPSVQLGLRLSKLRFHVGASIPIGGTVSHTTSGMTRKLKAVVVPDGVVTRVRGLLSLIYPSPSTPWILRANQKATFDTKDGVYCAEAGEGSIEVTVTSHSGNFFDDQDLRRLKVNIVCLNRPVTIARPGLSIGDQQTMTPLKADAPSSPGILGR